MLAKLQFYGLVILSVLAGLTGLFFYARNLGVQAERKKQQQESMEDYIDAKEVEREIDSYSHDDVIDELYSDWSR
jgi:hypothetical protein